MSVDLQKVVELAGEIPFKNIDNAKTIVENFCSNDVAVVVTNKTTNIAHGTHCHNSYEFVIAYSDLPSAVIDNIEYDRPQNALFAINPMQEHGIAVDYEGFNLCGIHISQSFMQNVAVSIYDDPNISFSNKSIIINHDLSMLVRLFLEELRYKQTGHEFIIENLSLLIAGYLARQLEHNLSSNPHKVSRHYKENIKTVIDYMNENYSSGISCTELSDLIKTDKFNFIRSFRAQTNKTPYEYLLDLKIEKAKKMLMSDKFSITEISMMCGFSSHSHFTSTFKRKTGISPKEYRLKP
jgi:AraC-like DNA-binding protein